MHEASDNVIEARFERTSVHLAGLLQVLSEALYSSRYVALRELVQNAHDSCIRRRLEDRTELEPEISVTVDPNRRLLHLADNGAGLTAAEIGEYLATIGKGYTRLLREREGRSDLIGCFGLGFLSAFAIADRVEVRTCSYQEPDQTWCYASKNAETYSLVAGEPAPVGTQVTLHLQKAFGEMADAAVIARLLGHYCCLLPIPIRVQGATLNEEPPPWRRSDVGPLRLRSLQLAFAEQFESRFTPITAFPIEPAAPATGLDGLLWVQDGGSYASSDCRNVSVFVRGMFVSGEELDLLPRWAGFVGAVVDCEQLAPTLSRESLQRDDAYRSVAEVLKESLIAGLCRIARSEPETWQRILLRHNDALLGAALSEERLFELLADQVTVPTSEGDLTLPELLHRSQRRIYVSQGDEGSFEELLLRAIKLPVVQGIRYAALPFCSLYSEQRACSLHILGTEGGNRSLFLPAELAEQQQEQLREWFAEPDYDVAVRRFEPSYLPLVVVPNREVELKRLLETDAANERISRGALRLAHLYTETIEDGCAAALFVNASSPVIRQLLTAPPEVRQRAVSLLKPIAQFLSQERGKRKPFEAALREYHEAVLQILQQH